MVTRMPGFQVACNLENPKGAQTKLLNNWYVSDHEWSSKASIMDRHGNI
jgi:hypothetical protein